MRIQISSFVLMKRLNDLDHNETHRPKKETFVDAAAAF